MRLCRFRISLGLQGMLWVSVGASTPPDETGHATRGPFLLTKSGEPPGTRTPNPQIKSLLLCQLS